MPVCRVNKYKLLNTAVKQNKEFDALQFKDPKSFNKFTLKFYIVI